MKSLDAPAGRITAQDYIVLGDGGAYLAGSRCTACNAVFLGERRVCAACGARERMATLRLGDRGRVYSCTTVCRSFPGVPVPFVMAVVDLDDGPALRGTLCDVDPQQVRFDIDAEQAGRVREVATALLPGQVSGQPLVQQLLPADGVQPGEMWVREVREDKGRRGALFRLLHAMTILRGLSGWPDHFAGSSK